MDDEFKRHESHWFEKIVKRLKKAWKDIGSFLKRFYPGKQAWRGAAVGTFILGYLATIIMAVDLILPTGWIYFLAVLVLFPVGFALAVILIILLLNLLGKLPKFFLVAFILSVLLTVTGFLLFSLNGLLLGIIIAVLGSLVGAGVWTLTRVGWKNLVPFKKAMTILGLLLGLCGAVFLGYWLIEPGNTMQMPERVDAEESSISSLADTLADPSLMGEYSVKSLTYGSGTDKRRSEFAEDVTIITESVDGSAFISGWSGLRELIWGFDADELPLNGRVWYPDAEGTFPLVLVVHGNHIAEEYSDSGYAYLCELLASRGAICVSVDENFLNGSYVSDLLGYSDLEEENDLRGWLLLEHLEVWEDFAGDAENPFYGKVDLSKIALIGHSRGGEAVAIAAYFNQLDHYPDNGLIEFDYDFDIQSVIAIAPVDNQYSPAGETVSLEDINYLVLQGSHDMDVNSFDGYNTFERVQFTGEDFYFKSAVYIWGANHGQFNTYWGDDDIGLPAIWLYNRGQLMPGEDQRKVAQVLISAFIDTTLKGEEEYLPLFQNTLSGEAWLPETVYLNAYADSEMTYLLTFEEDVDLTSGTISDVQITTQDLDGWREDRVITKWGRMTSNSAVYLKWKSADDDAMYVIQLGESIPALSTEDQLVFSAAQTDYDPEGEGDPEPADFLIELIDGAGNHASLSLSSIAALLPEYEAKLTKLDFLSEDPTSEVVFQTYLFKLSDFQAVNPLLDVADLSEIRIIFNQTDGGQIVLDNLGFRQTD